MSMRAALVLAAVVALADAGALFGQGFQGGVRGAVKDAGGVLPGVGVTLTNEKTSISRSTTTNERGEYVFSNIDPGTYAIKAVLAGYKTIDRREVPVGTQQFLTLDLMMEVGAIEENITVTGQSPIIETSNASQGTVLDSAALQSLPSPGRAAFLIGTTVPTVIPTGDTQFNRQQDQTNASLLSLGYLIIFGSVLAYTAYTWVLVHANVSRVSTYAYVNPVVALILGALILNEKIDPTMLLGAAIIIVSVWLVIRTEARRAPPATREPEPARALGAPPRTPP